MLTLKPEIWTMQTKKGKMQKIFFANLHRLTVVSYEAKKGKVIAKNKTRDELLCFCMGERFHHLTS